MMMYDPNSLIANEHKLTEKNAEQESIQRFINLGHMLTPFSLQQPFITIKYSTDYFDHQLVLLLSDWK